MLSEKEVEKLISEAKELELDVRNLTDLTFTRGKAIREFRRHLEAVRAFFLRERNPYGHECKWCHNCVKKLRSDNQKLLGSTTECLHGEPR